MDIWFELCIDNSDFPAIRRLSVYVCLPTVQMSLLGETYAYLYINTLQNLWRSTELKYLESFTWQFQLLISQNIILEYVSNYYLNTT